MNPLAALYRGVSDGRTEGETTIHIFVFRPYVRPVWYCLNPVKISIDMVPKLQILCNRYLLSSPHKLHYTWVDNAIPTICLIDWDNCRNTYAMMGSMARKNMIKREEGLQVAKSVARVVLKNIIYIHLNTSWLVGERCWRSTFCEF